MMDIHTSSVLLHLWEEHISYQLDTVALNGEALWSYGEQSIDGSRI